MFREGTNTVVVIGASVAGLFAAYKLAQAGVHVCVYEAQDAWAPDARTLIVTPACLELFDFDVSAAICNRTRVFELFSPGDSARVALREPDVVLERVTLMQMLAQKLREAGGELIMGQRFEGLAPGTHGKPLRLRFRNGQGVTHVGAHTVVGADGVHSTVAQAVGRGGLEEVHLLQARVPLPPEMAPDTVRCWFERGRTRFFYWLIPESDTEGVVGLIGDTEAETHAALAHFMATHALHAMDYQEAWVPMFSPHFQPEVMLEGGRVLLVGDAAGQVKVTTVGGVVTGIAGAAAAVRAILQGTAYSRELRALHRELRLHTWVRQMLDSFTDAAYDELLRLLNPRATHILSRYTRDELRRSAWPLLLAQPRWLLLGTRALAQHLIRGQLHDAELRST